MIRKSLRTSAQERAKAHYQLFYCPLGLGGFEEEAEVTEMDAGVDGVR